MVPGDMQHVVLFAVADHQRIGRVDTAVPLAESTSTWAEDLPTLPAALQPA